MIYWQKKTILGNFWDCSFCGLIDEVRVYSRALSAGEITDLYNLGARKVKFRQ